MRNLLKKLASSTNIYKVHNYIFLIIIINILLILLYKKNNLNNYQKQLFIVEIAMRSNPTTEHNSTLCIVG